MNSLVACNAIPSCWRKPAWFMASGPVTCQHQVAPLDNSGFHCIVVTQCPTVWHNIERTLLTFQLPSSSSKGSEIWCVQSFQMSALPDVMPQKSPHGFWGKQLLSGVSGQADLPCDALTSKCLTVLIFSLRSPQQSAWALWLISLGDGAVRGQFTHEWRWHWMEPETFGVQSQFYHLFIVWGKKSLLFLEGGSLHLGC